MHQMYVRNRVSIPILDGTMNAELITFNGLSDGLEHLALKLGEIKEGQVPVVRIHSECLTGDVFGSSRCDCGPQLKESIETIKTRGGYLLYLRQEGRGIGLYNKIDAYVLQNSGLNTYEANRRLGFADDQRNFKCAAEMLKALDTKHVVLLSNNPKKNMQLRENGIEVAETLSTGFYSNPSNLRYLEAKREFGGHQFETKNLKLIEA